MASYLAIPEEAVPPPLRRFVSQARGFLVDIMANHPCHGGAFLMAVLGVGFEVQSSFWSKVTMGNPLYIRETLDQLLQDGNLKAELFT